MEKDAKRDWTGNGNSIFKIVGASSHVAHDRADYDYYATDPKAAELLLRVEKFSPKIWECACGERHLADVFVKHGHEVRASDIVDRCGNEVHDFLGMGAEEWDGDIITNPPYRYALEFVQRALQTVGDGHKVAMFLKLLFLEGKERKQFFLSYPPKVVYVSSSRLKCAMDGVFDGKGSAVCYAWFVWEKGWKGDTVIKWIN